MDIDLYDAYTADEAFRDIDKFSAYALCRRSTANDIADGAVPGQVTSRLMNAYSGLVGMDFVQQYLERL